MAFLLAVVVWVLAVGSIVVMFHGAGTMTPAISDAAHSIDQQFFLTLAVTGVAFVLAQGLLGLFVFQFGDKKPGKPIYVHGNSKIEWSGIIICFVVFMTLGVLGQKVWAGLHLTDSDPNAVHVEILGEQFAWNVRYPGPDGQFGRTAPELYDAVRNPSGIDPDDAAGNDDVVILNRLVVPVATPIELHLRSKDVLHSFFMPALRIKQDLVPGLEIPLRFNANVSGDYEIACAELCGLGHYRMKGYLEIVERSEFDAWLTEQVGEIDR